MKIIFIPSLLSLVFCPVCLADCEAAGAAQNAHAIYGALVTEVPLVSTWVNLFNAILGSTSFGECGTTDIVGLIEESQRKQETMAAELGLKGITRQIKTHMDENRITPGRYDDLEKLRSDLETHRSTHFGGVDITFRKFPVFSLWATEEILLTELLIKESKKSRLPISDKLKHEINYGRALIFYLKTASEWSTDYIMSHTPYQAGQIKEAGWVYLRKPMIEWMNLAQNNDEVKKRLKKASKYTPYDPSGNAYFLNFVDKLGDERGIKKSQLPYPIKHGDWVSLKCTDSSWYSTRPSCNHQVGCVPTKKDLDHSGSLARIEQISPDSPWLSCWKSIKESDWCRYQTCPSTFGDKRDGQCAAEKFQIHSTHNIKSGPSKNQLKYESKFERKLGFKYWNWKCSEGRGEGNYWLSRWKNSRSLAYLYTETCPGDSFTVEDVENCEKESWSTQVPNTTQIPYKYHPTTTQKPLRYTNTIQIPYKYHQINKYHPNIYHINTQIPPQYHANTTLIPYKYLTNTLGQDKSFFKTVPFRLKTQLFVLENLAFDD